MSQLKGLSSVLRKLNKTIDDIELNTKAGLTEAALIVKADSVRNTPIDVGNLRGSAFIRVTGDVLSDNSSPSFIGTNASKLATQHSEVSQEMKGIVDKDKKIKIKAVIAYSAFYALYVHEMPAGSNFNSGTNKFLERALLKNKQRVLKTIIKHARIK